MTRIAEQEADLAAHGQHQAAVACSDVATQAELAPSDADSKPCMSSDAGVQTVVQQAVHQQQSTQTDDLPALQTAASKCGAHAAKGDDRAQQEQAPVVTEETALALKQEHMSAPIIAAVSQESVAQLQILVQAHAVRGNKYKLKCRQLEVVPDPSSRCAVYSVAML